MKIKALLLLVFLPVVLMSQTATINLNSEKQVIRGFGGMNHPSWAGDLTASQRLTAFENGPNQLGFSVLRIFIDGNKANWSREVATAKVAIAKGALVIASPWNPPSTMTELFTKSGDADAKRLKVSSYAAYAQHLIDFVTYMKTNGVALYAVSVQNEPDWGYDWTWWTPQEMLKFMKENAGEIKKYCKVIAPESLGYVKSMSDPILNDPTALANLDILGSHLYGTSYSNFTYPLFKQKGTGKELWMTEVYHPNSNTNSADLWPEALEVGFHIHNAMVEAEFQAYIWWYIRRQYSPMKEDGKISKRGYCMAHFSKFVRPGFIRVDATKTPTTNVSISAFKNGDDISIIAINKNTTAKTVTISVPAAKVPRWECYVTSGTKNLEKGNDINAKTSFKVTIEPLSMMTIVGKMEFGTPELKTANPENKSFDLPLTTNTFSFVYNNNIDCSKAKAKMSGLSVNFDLLLQETGFSDTLTFKLPESVTLTKGEYKILLSDIISDYGYSTKSKDSILIYIGKDDGNSQSISAIYNGLLTNAIKEADNTLSSIDSTIYDGDNKEALSQAIYNYKTTFFTAPSAITAAINDLKLKSAAYITHKTNVDYYISILEKAKKCKDTYSESKYNKESPYLKLVEKLNLYGNVNYSNDALLVVANDSLNHYTTLTPNWVNNAIPALTFRLNKAIELAEKTGVDASVIESAKSITKDDETTISNLKNQIKTKLNASLVAGTFKFGKSSTDPKFTDSLELTCFIKNPNFYTYQKVTGISTNTFPGWTVTTANTNASATPELLATIINPVIDTDAKLVNTNISKFEQRITGLPSGYYNVYMNTRIPTNVTIGNVFVFYAKTTGVDTLKTNFRKGGINDRLQTGLKQVKVTDGILTIGVRAGTSTNSPTIRWGDPTLWMVESTVVTGLKNIDTESSVKEIQYFSLMGYRINKPENGMFIIKTLFENGKTEIRKVQIE